MTWGDMYGAQVTSMENIQKPNSISRCWSFEARNDGEKCEIHPHPEISGEIEKGDMEVVVGEGGQAKLNLI